MRIGTTFSPYTAFQATTGGYEGMGYAEMLSQRNLDVNSMGVNVLQPAMTTVVEALSPELIAELQHVGLSKLQIAREYMMFAGIDECEPKDLFA